MAELTRQELITAIDALFPTNNNELISASNARSAFRNFIESTYNKADDNINNNASVSEWNNVISYPLDFIITFNDKFWRSKVSNNTNHVPAENAYWTEVSKATAGQNIDLSHYYLKQELQTAGEAQVALENILGLVLALNGKANSTHTHNITDISNLQNTLNTKSDALSLGRILFVSKNGNNNTAEIGKIDKPFLTIQAALNACSSGDTIMVIAGAYTENLATTDKTIFLNFIGNCVLNGNIEKYNGNWGFASFLSIIGEELIINGNITIATNLTNTKNYIKVKKINSGNLVPLNADFRTTWIIKDTEIVTNTNVNVTDNGFNSYTNCEIKAIGLFYFGAGVATNCKIECSSIFVRQDMGFVPKLETCNVTTTTTNVIFIGQFTTLNNYIILRNCRFIASCNYLGTDGGFRPFNIDAKYCDFSQCNFAIALFNLADSNQINQTQIYIDYCKFKSGVVFNQQGNNNMPSGQYYSFDYNIT